MYACKCVCIYTYFYTYIHTCIYIYIYTHTHTHTHKDLRLCVTSAITSHIVWYKLIPHKTLVFTPSLVRAQWLRCCVTNRKIAGSIPPGVSGFSIDIKSFRSHYGPGVDSASNRNEYQEYFLGVKTAGA